MLIASLGLEVEITVWWEVNGIMDLLEVINLLVVKDWIQAVTFRLYLQRQSAVAFGNPERKALRNIAYVCVSDSLRYAISQICDYVPLGHEEGKL